MFYDFRSVPHPDYRRWTNIACIALAVVFAAMAIFGVRQQLSETYGGNKALKELIDRKPEVVSGSVLHLEHIQHDYDYPSTGDSTTVSLYFHYWTRKGQEICRRGPFNWIGDQEPKLPWKRITVPSTSFQCGSRVSLQPNPDNKLWEADVSIHYIPSNPEQFYSPQLYSEQPSATFRWQILVRATLAVSLGSALVFFLLQFIWFPLVGPPTVRITARIAEFMDERVTYNQREQGPSGSA
jgi:hypothetical protein